MSDEHAKHAAEAAMGAVTELVKRGGTNLGPHHAHGAAKLGEFAVRGVAVVAPGAVAAAAAGTASVVAGATAVAVAAAPFVIVGAAGLAAYKLYEWLNE